MILLLVNWKTRGDWESGTRSAVTHLSHSDVHVWKEPFPFGRAFLFGFSVAPTAL